MTKSGKLYLQYIYIDGLLIVPLVLLILPAGFFDDGPPICISVLLFDQQCYGCGITRAVQHMMHFDYETAMSYNKLVVIVLPLLIYVWFEQIITTRKKIRRLKQQPDS